MKLEHSFPVRCTRPQNSGQPLSGFSCVCEIVKGIMEPWDTPQVKVLNRSLLAPLPFTKQHHASWLLFSSFQHFSPTHKAIVRTVFQQVWMVVGRRDYPVDHRDCCHWCCQHSRCPLLCKAWHLFSCWQHGHTILQQYWAISCLFELWIQKHHIPHSYTGGFIKYCYKH